jgi:dihydrofolate reductase
LRPLGAGRSRVVYYAAATVDGYIAEADDTLDWLTSYDGRAGNDVEAVEGGYDEFYERVGALVMGAVTYGWILGHMERTGTGWIYPGKPCWILSSRELPVPDGEDVRIVNGQVAELSEEMLASAGDRDLWVVGGGNVASQFADAGLLDELIVTVVPVVLGAGKPLFDRRIAGAPMRLVGALPRSNGMVELRYDLAR